MNLLDKYNQMEIVELWINFEKHYKNKRPREQLILIDELKKREMISEEDYQSKLERIKIRIKEGNKFNWKQYLLGIVIGLTLLLLPALLKLNQPEAFAYAILFSPFLMIKSPIIMLAIIGLAIALKPKYPYLVLGIVTPYIILVLVIAGIFMY